MAIQKAIAPPFRSFSFFLPALWEHTLLHALPPRDDYTKA